MVFDQELFEERGGPGAGQVSCAACGGQQSVRVDAVTGKPEQQKEPGVHGYH